jgi:uncharacterized protein YdgA (DUF945 family)
MIFCAIVTTMFGIENREKTLKKGLLITVAALVVLYPLSAGLMGYAIERRVDDTLKQATDQTPYIKVVDHQYHRGWFVSEQDLTVGISPQMAATAAVNITIHNVIHHGPICGPTCWGLARIDSHLVFSGPIQPVVTSIFGLAEALSMHSRLGFFGGGSATVASPPVADIALSGGDHFSSEGMTLATGYTANYDSYTAHGSIPHVKYTGATGKLLEIAAVSVDLHSTRALRSLFVGDTSIDVGEIAYGASGTPGAFSAHAIQAESHSSLADGFMVASVKYSVGAVASAPVSLTGAHFDMTFRHLEAESLEHLTAAMRQTNQDTTLSPATRVPKMMAALKEPAMALLAKQPEISLDRISIATAGGGAVLTGVIKVNGVVAEDFRDETSTKRLAQKIDADLDLTLDDGFLSSVPGGGADSVSKLQSFVDQGLMTHDGGKFHTVIGLHQGQPTFNGKPFGPAVSNQK